MGCGGLCPNCWHESFILCPSILFWLRKRSKHEPRKELDGSTVSHVHWNVILVFSMWVSLTFTTDRIVMGFQVCSQTAVKTKKKLLLWSDDAAHDVPSKATV